MKEEDQKLFAEFIDAKLDWDVSFTRRFTNRMSRTGYIIFEERFLPSRVSHYAKKCTIFSPKEMAYPEEWTVIDADIEEGKCTTLKVRF